MILAHSMRWRLQFWYGLLLAVVLGGFGVTAYLYERGALLRSTDAELERRAGGLTRVFKNAGERDAAPPRPPPPRDDDEVRPDDRPPPDAPEGTDLPRGRPSRRGEPSLRPFPPDEEAGYSGDSRTGWYYVLWLRGGRSVTRSQNAPADVRRPLKGDILVHGPNFRASALRREVFMPLGPGDVLVVGRQMADDLDGLRRFGWIMAGVASAILVLALAGGRILVERSLAPIADISETARTLSRGDLSRRINSADTDGELGQLAEVLNETFARLEQAFHEQARFTADAAHELRTPVAVLLTHTQNALASPCASEEHQEAFAACHRAAQRMRSLIESLLQLSRLDASGRPLRLVPVDLAARASEVVDLLRPLAATKEMRFVLELGPAPCAADPEEIDRVIVNLVTNAISHHPGKGEVRVRTGEVPGGVELRVRDNGVGIAPEHLSRVFDRFYRADASRSRASGGTGLGLAITKAIVERHGGTITVQSELGAGAYFTVFIPVAG